MLFPIYIFDKYLNKTIVSSELTEAVSPSNTLDQPGLDLGKWHPNQASSQVIPLIVQFSDG